jgi:DNA anti-recombination protein RmuC
MGRSINTVKTDYEDLMMTRRRQLEKPLDKIEDITNLVDSSKSGNLEGQQKL